MYRNLKPLLDIIGKRHVSRNDKKQLRNFHVLGLLSSYGYTLILAIECFLKTNQHLSMHHQFRIVLYRDIALK